MKRFNSVVFCSSISLADLFVIFLSAHFLGWWSLAIAAIVSVPSAIFKSRMRKGEARRIATGAVYDFAGFLTVQDTPLVTSRKHGTTRIAALVTEFYSSRRVDSDDPMVQEWQDKCR